MLRTDGSIRTVPDADRYGWGAGVLVETRSAEVEEVSQPGLLLLLLSESVAVVVIAVAAVAVAIAVAVARVVPRVRARV